MNNSVHSQAKFKVIRYPKVDSTNRIAVDLGNRESPHGTIVLAGEQSGGRGRQSRSFTSPTGGLYMSTILRPQLPVDKLSLITLAAGVACAKSIESVTGISVLLKWPNDLYCNGKKLGGILTEAAAYSQACRSIPFVVVGIGMNINTRPESFPDSLQDLVTSLYCVTGKEYEIESLLHALATALLAEVLLLHESPEKVLAHWRVRDFLLGKNINWQDSKGKPLQGKGNGLLPDGRYRLTTTGGDDYPVLAGDITITDIDGQYIK